MTNGLITACREWLSEAAHALEHHPRHITALLAALLLGGGGGALAVASLGPDAAALPVTEVIESVQTLPLQPQADALDAYTLTLFRSETTRATDTAEALLARLGIHDPAAARFLRTDAIFRAQFLGRAGRSVTVEASASHSLDGLTGRWVQDDDGHFKRLVIARVGPGQFSSRVETALLVASPRLGSGTVRTSLFAAVDDARIPDDIAVQIVDILSGEVDFQRGLRRGDRFNVVYESLEADGEAMRTGRVLSIEFVNNGKPHQAVWYEEPGRKGGYFSLEGRSLTSAYLASPMEFSRVTSGFSMRLHPLLQQWKQHLGVDYGAPTGTPVRSVGDGKVEFAGVQNGFGNVVTVRHNATDVTLYAHLSRIDVRLGQHVAQGQRIGAVGATGWATGPHLHFEFRVDGAHQDPVEVARRHPATALSAAVLPAFDKLARSMRLQLAAAASSTAVALAQ